MKIAGTQSVVLKIDGMVGDSCAKTVAHALLGVDGVKNAVVSLRTHTAVISLETEIQPQDMISAVEDSGFQAELVY